MAYGRAAYTRAPCASAPSATSWTPRPRTCWRSTPTRSGRWSWTSRPRPTTSRSATRTCWAGSTSSPTAATPGRTTSTSRSRQGRRPHRVRRLRAVGVLRRQVPLGVGGRVDKFGNIDDPVFSPRVSVMFKPTPDHSIRASYNRAFVSPSFINNYLNQNISNTDPIIDLTPLKPLIGPAAALVPPPFFLTSTPTGTRTSRSSPPTASSSPTPGPSAGRRRSGSPSTRPTPTTTSTS